MAFDQTRTKLLSGHGVPTDPPDDVTVVWVYLDLDTGVLIPWNNETGAWMI